MASHAITINTLDPTAPPAWACTCGAGTITEWDGIVRARQHAETHGVPFAPTFANRQPEAAQQ